MKILIVDDEVAITEFFHRVATAQGFHDVEVVESAQDAVTSVLRSNFDLISLDVRMPEVSGLEIIAILRNMNPHAVIAVISGFIPEDIPEEVLSCIDLLLPKPVSVETFIALLDGAQQLAETIEGIRQLGEPAAVLR
ncbi:MAG: response regulator [Chloroflexi bacterium]|nr:response regulator [Chloroflexota bacterium]